MYGICKEKYYFEHELAEDRSGVAYVSASVELLSSMVFISQNFEERLNFSARSEEKALRQKEG